MDEDFIEIGNIEELSDEFDEDEISIVLEYIDDLDEYQPDYTVAEVQVRRVLEQFTEEEILQMNEVDLGEALAYMYWHGDIGLPVSVQEDDEIQGEEDEASDPD